jgi:SAM-dependent methyltransferase
MRIDDLPMPSAPAAPVRAFRLADPAGADVPLLSHAARRVREQLGIPITALPGLEAEDAVYVLEHTRALNELIDGRPARTGVWTVIGRHRSVAEGGFERVATQRPPAFPALWSPGEVREIESGGLRGMEGEWRARVAAHPFWGHARACLRDEPCYADVWREILGGDFDVTGRGVEYTKGMEVFQASRWFGARTLLSLLGARGGEGLFLDVLGGDGYVWRLLQAEACAAESRLALVEGGAWPSFDAGDPPAEIAETVDALLSAAPDVAVLVVGEPPAPRAPIPAVLFGHGGRAATLALSDGELAHLGSLPEAVPYRDGDPFPPPAPLAGARIVTNDLSPHMFARAGAWGMPTREDATRLRRTFREASVDGVLLAYGTHHVPDLFAAAREAGRVVRRGGRVVMHDFFDEGPAGQWFHRIVDKRSITGHDFPHIGPVQMAAALLRAGLRHVRLHEIQDPFLFASDDERVPARDLALGYIAGMYGLAAGFPNGLGEMEDAIHEILTYPEVGEVPRFGPSFVYIPRRAVVATAVRPEDDAEPHAEDDLRLMRTLSSLFRRDPAELADALELPDDVARYWFPAPGRRWGVDDDERAEWLAWADDLRSARAVGG